MLKYRLLQERLRDLLTKALAGGPSALREAGALKLTSGPSMAGQAASGPSAAAAARLQQTAGGGGGGAGGSGQHVSRRFLWAGPRPPALQHRPGRPARAQAAAGSQWGPDGPHASIQTAVARPSAQPAFLAEPLLAEPDAAPAQPEGEPPLGFLGGGIAEQSQRSAGGGQPAAPAAAAAGEVSVQGSVHKVTFRAEDTGYTVFRLQLADGSPAAGEAARDGARRRRVITVVGTLPPVAVGQSLSLRGAWVEHTQYGRQLKVSDFSELSPTTTGEMEAYLGGGAIAGVGPATAKRLVDRWGADIESKLSSPAAVDFLQQCDGIGRSKAEKIKRAWDATQGTREGVMFLKEHGIPLPLAQRIAQRHGPLTVHRVRRDPYFALAGCGLPFSKVDLLASRVGAPADLVSRAALAMRHCLSSAAANEGHTHLPWHLLARGAQQLLDDAALQNAQPWQHPDSLHLVAQHMHAVGSLVAEPGAQPAGGPGAEVGPGRGEDGGAVPAAASAPAPSSPAFDSVEELRAYVDGRLSEVGPGLVDSMVERYALGLLAVLDAPLEEAVKKLSLCRRIGPKTAEKIKAAWEQARGLGEPGKHGAGAAGSSALTMPRLLAEPPPAAFAWGPDTRCYSPRMHAAECTVAGSALQRAAAYRPPTARQTARVRKWAQANQVTTAQQLSEGQVRALEVASDAPLMVLTGGPGCGKTTVVQTIVKLWAAQNKVVRIAAPTGRAAQRMGAMQGIEPCTIHRLLGYQPRGAVGAAANNNSKVQADEEDLGQGTFFYNKSNPLAASAVLVDEASMLSLPLAAALFDALLPRCQLVLVGDVDQLPPVGPGSVLRSLIASRLVPVVDLREIFRQQAQSAIITSALAVRRGDVPLLQRVPPEAAALAAPPSDALLVPTAAAPGDMVAAVRQSVVALRQAHMRAGGPEPDLQVISPMRKGPAGTGTLNPMLQALLNPPARNKAEVPRSHGGGGGGREGEGEGEARCFRVGDAVIQLVNDYDKEVFNGDQGRVVACLPQDRCVRVHFPHLGGEEGLRQYRGMELSQLELAYAITVHKAQGGESAHVVLALSPQHGRMLTRRLLYTGLTRAKRQLVVVCAGSGTASDPLALAVRQRDSGERLTWLRARLEEGQRERALPQLEPQSFSNEEQMLAQAAQWQQQALQQAGADGAASAAEPATRNGWARAASAPGPPPETSLAEVRRQLQEREGLSDEEAEEVVQHLRRRAPQALADWDRAVAAAAWLGERLGGGAALRQLARAAPQLLEADQARLHTCWSFLEQRPGFEASGGNGVLEGLHALRRQLGAGQQQQQPPQQQQQQQQQRAEAG